MPVGQGADQPVQVRAGWLRSRPASMSYIPPTIDWTSVQSTNMSMPFDGDSIPTNARRSLAADGGWDRPPTQGQVLTLKGANLGTAGSMLDESLSFDDGSSAAGSAGAARTMFDM